MVIDIENRSTINSTFFFF